MSTCMRIAIASALVVAVPAGTAHAAAVPVSGPSLLAASAVALTGLIFLVVGVSRLASGTGVPALRFGGRGGRGRFGGGNRATEGDLRRAVTSILVGVALLGLPDMLGAGVVSQIRVAYEQSRPSQPRYIRGSDITTKEPSRSYSSSAAGQEATEAPSSFPWWVLGVVGLFVLIAVAVRTLTRNDVRTAASARSEAEKGGRFPAEVDGHPLSLGPDLPEAVSSAAESSGADMTSEPARSAFDILFDTIGRFRERMRILLKNAKEQLRRLADETEEQKGRFRPLAAFAVQQATSLFRALADRDDGGSGLPRAAESPDPRLVDDRANASAYAERIGAILSLQGANLVSQIAKALGVSRKRAEADLHRLGASGAPGAWVRVVKADIERDWTLAEHQDRSDDRRFEGVVRFDQVDWFATLSVQDRPFNLGLIIAPLPGRQVHLVSVRDDRAEALAVEARSRIRLPDGGSWVLADLPLERIVRHFGQESDGRWVVDPDGQDDEILVFDLQPKQIVISSGSDRLRRAVASEENPVRALVHVRHGAALAALGVSIVDVVPLE